MNTGQPLEGVGSIKVKLGLLVGASCVVAALFATIGERAGMPAWLTLPVTVAAALLVTQWLARGMTAPLREMTDAASRMAAGSSPSARSLETRTRLPLDLLILSPSRPTMPACAKCLASGTPARE